MSAEEAITSSIFQFGKVADCKVYLSFELDFSIGCFDRIPRETRLTDDVSSRLSRLIVLAHARVALELPDDVNRPELHAGMQAIAFRVSYWGMSDGDRERLAGQYADTICSIKILRNLLYNSQLRDRLRDSRDERIKGTVERLKVAANKVAANG